jgi:hypothetical protein
MKHNHKDGEECEACKLGLDVVLQKEQALMKKYGWLVHFVPGSEGVPFGMNIHTHGLLESFGHLDLQICLNMPHGTNTFGLSIQRMRKISNLAIN